MRYLLGVLTLGLLLATLVWPPDAQAGQHQRDRTRGRDRQRSCWLAQDPWVCPQASPLADRQRDRTGNQQQDRDRLQDPQGDPNRGEVCPNPDCPNPDCPCDDCPNPDCPRSQGVYAGTAACPMTCTHDQRRDRRRDGSCRQ